MPISAVSPARTTRRCRRSSSGNPAIDRGKARKKANDQARAGNIRQGYTYDPLLEEATEAYVAGDIGRYEYRARVVRPSKHS
ncbi:hypothetical protein ACCS93_29830 [Rhizobium ruizarguesonis]